MERVAGPRRARPGPRGPRRAFKERMSLRTSHISTRRARLLFCIAAAMGAVVLPRVAAAALRFDSDSVQVPIDLRGNLIYLRGRIGDSDSLWIVLDSGSSSSAMNESRALALGLRITGTSHAEGSGGSAVGGTIPSATVRLPGLTLESEPIGTLPLDSLGARSGRPMDVILGYPLLSRCVARIDYTARTLTLYRSDRFRYAGGGAALPLTFYNHLPYVTARVTVPGQEPVEGRFVIDTGSSQAVILAAPFVREHRVLEAVAHTIQGRGHGVGGDSQSQVARMQRLELGGFRLEQPIAMLRTSTAGRIAADGAIGNLGGEILQRFTVTFDYPRRRMILEPNPRLGEPFESDMSGLGLRVRPHAFQVEWVQPGSPAAEAGIQPEDMIESVDGKSADELGMPALRELFRHAAETHRLIIRRRDQRTEVALTTRRMI